MDSIIFPIIMLFIANMFMTFAWYGHLRHLTTHPIYIAIFISWGIAFFEYIFQVPANRFGSKHFTLGQLKIIQEIITMVVFAFFSVFYMKIPFRTDFIWAGLCLVGAAYFMFRGQGTH